MCSIVGSRSCKRHREGAGAWLRSHHAVLSLNWIAYSCWSLLSRSSFTAYIHICSPGSPVLGSTSSNTFLFQPPPQFLNCSMPGWLRSRGSSYSTQPPQAHRSLLGLGQKGILSFSLNSCKPQISRFSYHTILQILPPWPPNPHCQL